MRTTIVLSRAQHQWYAAWAPKAAALTLVPNGVAEPAPRRAPARGPRRARRRAGPGPCPHGLPDAPREGARRPARGAARHTPGGPARGGAGRRRPAGARIRERVALDPLLRDRVRVLGFRSDVDDLLAACDLVIHPSRADALPTALVSAIASRRAVVATDVGGIPDIVGHGVGELVPSGVPEALAAAVTALVADPQRRDERGHRGRARYEREFSATVWAGRLREVYAEALQPPPSARPRSTSAAPGLLPTAPGATQQPGGPRDRSKRRHPQCCHALPAGQRQERGPGRDPRPLPPQSARDPDPLPARGPSPRPTSRELRRHRRPRAGSSAAPRAGGQPGLRAAA